MIGRVNTASSPARDPRQRSFRIAVIAASVVAATVGSLWLATRDSGEKETTRGVTATLRVRGQPGSLVAGDGALWVALADARPPIRDRPLLRLDLASGAEQRNVLVGGQASYLMHAGARLIASVQHVGGAGSGPSLVVALDWRTGRALVRRQFAGAIGPLALDGRDIWALQVRPAALLRLDARTLTQKAAPLALSRGRGLGLAVGASYAWVTAADAGDVLRIDPQPVRSPICTSAGSLSGSPSPADTSGTPIASEASSVASSRGGFGPSVGPSTSAPSRAGWRRREASSSSATGTVGRLPGSTCAREGRSARRSASRRPRRPSPGSRWRRRGRRSG